MGKIANGVKIGNRSLPKKGIGRDLKSEEFFGNTRHGLTKELRTIQLIGAGLT